MVSLNIVSAPRARNFKKTCQTPAEMRAQSELNNKRIRALKFLPMPKLSRAPIDRALLRVAMEIKAKAALNKHYGRKKGGVARV